ncbi:translation initiation factor IF-2-like [Manduca sexta]|uniref:translation initiation factor IF-2-like n=1 Tax=Manduca sexta TaxID=7130 RepID=UPI00188E6907|nr:translation initiation factor IF-2-like [Manduca sexta]
MSICHEDTGGRLLVEVSPESSVFGGAGAPQTGDRPLPVELKREEARKRAEEELEERLRYVKSPLPPRTDTDDDLPVLKEDLIQCGQIVRAIVRKSGNLKGTSQKALNRVINLITRYVQQPESAAIARLEEERKKWRENSERLEESVKRLEEENLPPPSARGPGSVKQLQDHHGGDAGHGGGKGAGPQPKTKKEKGKGKGKKTASAHPTPAPVAGPSSAPLQDIAGPSTAAAGSPAQPATKRKQAKTAPNNKTASGPKPQKGVKKTAPPSGTPPIAASSGLNGGTVD